MERGGNQKSDLSWLYQVINIYVELFKFRSCKNDLDATISILNIHMGTQIDRGGEREAGRKAERERERGVGRGLTADACWVECRLLMQVWHVHLTHCPLCRAFQWSSSAVSRWVGCRPPQLLTVPFAFVSFAWGRWGNPVFPSTLSLSARVWPCLLFPNSLSTGVLSLPITAIS